MDVSLNTLMNIRIAGNILFTCALKECLNVIHRVIIQDCNFTLGGILLHVKSEDCGSVFILYFCNVSLV